MNDSKLALADDPSLDQIEAMEAEEGPWRIADLEGLSFGVDVLAKAEKDRENVEKLYAAAIKRLDAWRTERLHAVDVGSSYILAEVTRYATENRKELVKGRSKTISLPSGEISWRKVGGKLTVVDKEELTNWCIEQGVEKQLYRVKTEPDLKALAALFKTTGEIPPGCDAVPEVESITIKPSTPLLPQEIP